jgi:hypothetical protein
MFNRILKRPMFRRGGASFSVQGTGITSGLDTPRRGYKRGLVVEPGGYKGDIEVATINKLEAKDKYEKAIEDQGKTITESIKAPSGELLDYFASFSDVQKDQYGNDETAGQTSYRGYEKVMDKRRDYQDKKAAAQIAAAEAGVEGAKTIYEATTDAEIKMLTQKLANEGAINVAEIANAFENTATGGMIQEIKSRTDLDEKTKNKMIQEIIMKSNKPKLIANLTQAILDNASANMITLDPTKAAEQAAQIVGNIYVMIGMGETFAKGGRVGLQQSYPGTAGEAQAAAPQQASFTETENIMTPNQDVQISETETVSGQRPVVQMPYEEFRAAIPAEVSDEVVQLIYYNEDAFADFSDISTQADIYAFNNKYGVTLVLPMDTETV